MPARRSAASPTSTRRRSTTSAPSTRPITGPTTPCWSSPAISIRPQLDRWVDQYFAPLKTPGAADPAGDRGRAAAHRARPPSPSMPPNTPLPAVAISWQIPPARSPDDAALSVLDAILSAGEIVAAVRKPGLPRPARDERRAATSTTATTPACFAVYAIIAGGKNVADGEAALRREVARLRDAPVGRRRARHRQEPAADHGDQGARDAARPRLDPRRGGDRRRRPGRRRPRHRRHRRRHRRRRPARRAQVSRRTAPARRSAICPPRAGARPDAVAAVAPTVAVAPLAVPRRRRRSSSPRPPGRAHRAAAARAAGRRCRCRSSPSGRCRTACASPSPAATTCR